MRRHRSVHSLEVRANCSILVAILNNIYEFHGGKVPTTSRASEALLEELLAFERLLFDLSARFANVAGEQVVSEIENTLKQLIEFLGFDRCTFAEHIEGKPYILCSVAVEGVEPHLPGPVATHQGWFHNKVLSGRPTVIRSYEDFPPEAAATAEYYRSIGMCSILLIPLTVGGRVVASIGLGSVGPTREWPEEFIARVKVVGEVLAQALMRKRSEGALRASEAETARLMRQTLLSELSGTIAHEISQPLTAILANAETAQDLLSQKNIDLGKIKEIVADIIEQDSRASEVIGRVRKLLRKGENKPEIIDVNQLVESTIHLLRGEFRRRKVNIDFVPAHNLPMISGDPVQLQQVLLNLIINAMDAMSAKAPSQRAINITARANDKKIEVAIVDSGSGLADDDKVRLFEPLFTTKPHGLGLGLSICSTIIKAHGGTLSIENNAGDGATAVVAFPTPEPDHVRASPLSHTS
jgi:signal transduction histidine kinase